MKYEEARQEFIQSWGSLGSAWGINKTMAQIHAYLLSSPAAATTDQIMADLMISRGNANMNVRTLVDWGLVHKVSKPGERMDFYEADKDVHSFAPKIARERHKREIEPMLRTLSRVAEFEQDERAEAQEFRQVIGEIKDFSSLGDQILRRFMVRERGWLTKLLSRMLN